MNVNYRLGKKDDCRRIAELDYIASDGAVEYLFHDLIPNVPAIEVLSNGLEQDIYPHTFRSCIVAESNQEIVGVALSYPAKFHCITKELVNFLPPDRLNRFREFYSSRVEGSYFLGAMCVDEAYQQRGIGKSLLEQTKEKSRNEGYSELSLIVFSDNTIAIKLYEEHGFKSIKNIKLESHPLIPHVGGCKLMKCSL
ncbi:GNAT family N-acetyltransferase [Microbulbifer sp. ANSA001]|uniref:GNAT family N-acetyltransferase n=1 Tax=Microbulbifer sp. ANSA001 TaxID=3243358 RepID=UPI00404217B5